VALSLGSNMRYDSERSTHGLKKDRLADRRHLPIDIAPDQGFLSVKAPIGAYGSVGSLNHWETHTRDPQPNIRLTEQRDQDRWET
jgi:hypothetical protein